VAQIKNFIFWAVAGLFCGSPFFGLRIKNYELRFALHQPL